MLHCIKDEKVTVHVTIHTVHQKGVFSSHISPYSIWPVWAVSHPKLFLVLIWLLLEKKFGHKIWPNSWGYYKYISSFTIQGIGFWVQKYKYLTEKSVLEEVFDWRHAYSFKLYGSFCYKTPIHILSYACS